MTNLINQFIETIVTAAKANNEAKLATILKDSILSIHVCDNNRLSAAMILASQGSKNACYLLLEKHNASLNDMSCGAALAGNDVLTEEFIKAILQGNNTPNYSRIAEFAARGGHQKFAEGLLNNLPEDKRDYNLVAGGAAQGGHQKLAEDLLNNLPKEKRDYNHVAAGAAWGGHQRLAEELLNHLPEDKRDYNHVAARAAQGGHQKLAEDLLNNLPKEKRHYNLVAAFASLGGHQNIEQYFKSKISSVNANPPMLFNAAAGNSPSREKQNSPKEETIKLRQETNS